jgi:deoxycytidylate deaminase
MVTIDNIPYEFKRLHRFEELAAAMLHKPTGSFKHFAFIARGTRILSIGWNDLQAKSFKIVTNGERPFAVNYPLGGLHAEANAIRKMDDLNDCKKATLISIRLSNKKQLRNGCPCEDCMKVIQVVGFKRVYYSTNDGFQKFRL